MPNFMCENLGTPMIEGIYRHRCKNGVRFT